MNSVWVWIFTSIIFNPHLRVASLERLQGKKSSPQISAQTLITSINHRGNLMVQGGIKPCISILLQCEPL